MLDHSGVRLSIWSSLVLITALSEQTNWACSWSTVAQAVLVSDLVLFRAASCASALAAQAGHMPSVVTVERGASGMTR
jgi:hypothetical protein